MACDQDRSAGSSERYELFGLKLGSLSLAATRTWLPIPAPPNWSENKPLSVPDVSGPPLPPLGALLRGEHSVNLLAEHVGAQSSAVPQHLPKLRLGHLVRTRRKGTHVFYLAQNDHDRRIVEEALFHAAHVVQGLADHDEPQTAQPITGRQPA